VALDPGDHKARRQHDDDKERLKQDFEVVRRERVVDGGQPISLQANGKACPKQCADAPENFGKRTAPEKSPRRTRGLGIGSALSCSISGSINKSLSTNHYHKFASNLRDTSDEVP
jgi:hypothetical protein